MQVMIGFEKMCGKLLNREDSATASRQFPKFRLSDGLFGTDNSKTNAKKIIAWRWWMQYGSDVPELQKVAVKVLAQCSSACSCERNWSSYSFIHSKARNRLLPARARDLVFVFTNLRLLEKMQEAEYDELFPAHDSASDDEF